MDFGNQLKLLQSKKGELKMYKRKKLVNKIRKFSKEFQFNDQLQKLLLRPGLTDDITL